MKDFFKVKQPPPAPKLRGRPKRKVGRPKTTLEIADEIEHEVMPNEAATDNTENSIIEEGGGVPPPTASNDTTKNTLTAKCINWGKSPHCELLEEALNAWNNKEDMKFDENGEEILDYKFFANRMQIPPPTFYAYIHPDPKKRRTLEDGSRGKPKLLSNEKVKFVGEVLAWQDCRNDGYSIKEATDLIMTLKPEVNQEAA